MKTNAEQNAVLLLASASPRRRDLLQQACVPFAVVKSDAAELPVTEGISPSAFTLENARRKAEAVSAQHDGRPVLGADTVVSLDGEILGKPSSRADAKRMLQKLSGRTHTVTTGVWLTDGCKAEQATSETQVTFYDLSEEWIDWYVSTGECDDKAGAYGIQSLGSLLVKRIDGDYFNVVGLPVGQVVRMLERF